MTRPYYPEYTASGTAHQHKWVRLEAPMYNTVLWILSGPPLQAAAAIKRVMPPVYWKDCQKSWEPEKREKEFIESHGLIISDVVKDGTLVGIVWVHHESPDKLSALVHESVHMAKVMISAMGISEEPHDETLPYCVEWIYRCGREIL